MPDAQGVVRGVQEGISLLWRSRFGAFVVAAAGVAVGVIALFKDPLAGAIILGALILGGSALAFYGLYLRTQLGDDVEVVDGEDCWEIEDVEGRRVLLHHRRKYRIMHDGTYVIRDRARGDGPLTDPGTCGRGPTTVSSDRVVCCRRVAKHDHLSWNDEEAQRHR